VTTPPVRPQRSLALSGGKTFLSFAQCSKGLIAAKSCLAVQHFLVVILDTGDLLQQILQALSFAIDKLASQGNSPASLSHRSLSPIFNLSSTQALEEFHEFRRLVLQAQAGLNMNEHDV
jgi:hypothetical protein